MLLVMLCMSVKFDTTPERKVLKSGCKRWKSLVDILNRTRLQRLKEMVPLVYEEAKAKAIAKINASSKLTPPSIFGKLSL